MDTKKQVQLDRIAAMEQLREEALEKIGRMKLALEDYADAVRNVEILKGYVQSEFWMQDYEADEQGELPADLGRGILSEDGFEELYSAWQEVEKKLQRNGTI